MLTRILLSTAINSLLANFRYQWPRELLELPEFKLLGNDIIVLIVNSGYIYSIYGEVLLLMCL